MPESRVFGNSHDPHHLVSCKANPEDAEALLATASVLDLSDFPGVLFELGQAVGPGVGGVRGRWPISVSSESECFVA